MTNSLQTTTLTMAEPTPQRRSLRWAIPLLLVVVVVLAFGVRLLTFDRYLPYLEYGDESNMYLLARDWRGVEEVPVVPEWLAGYPPLYVWVNILVQQTVEATWTRSWIFPSEYFYYTRLLAAVVGGLATLVIMRLGWHLGGGVAALFAGSSWALTPLVVDHNSLAIPDPFVYLFCALALVTALQALRSSSPGWLIGSLIAALAAIYTKYPAVFALMPWGIAMLLLLRKDWRRWIPWLLVSLGLAAAAGVYLVFGYGAFALSNREADSVRDQGLAYLLNLSRHVNNWYYAILPIGVTVFFAAVIVGSASYFVSRRRGWQTIALTPIGVILLYAFVGIALTTTYTNVWLGAGKIRHSLPITVGLIGVWSALIVQIYWTVRDWQRSQERFPLPRLADAFLIVFGLIMGLTLLDGSLTSVRKFSLTPTLLLAQQYSDNSLPADGLVLFHPRSVLGALYNRPWSGYSGATPFEWLLEDPTGSTPGVLAERGITYFASSSEDGARIENAAALQAFEAQLTRISTVAPGEGEEGPVISFYRILPPQVSTDIVFGDQIRLEGYDLSASALSAGDSLNFRPYWRALRTPHSNYSMFVHLYPADDTTLISQFDGTLGQPNRLTLTWTNPNELLIGNAASLTVPPDTPPGDYVLAVGVYDFTNGTRLLTGQNTSFTTIPIEIR